MNSRLDEIFSPDRLRRNWQAQWTPEPAPPLVARNAEIQAHYRQLLNLIAATFPDTSHLDVLYDEIDQGIGSSFPIEAEQEVDEAEKRRIVDLLEQLEDLLWAQSLPKGSDR